jgi:hypothetical protein
MYTVLIVRALGIEPAQGLLTEKFLYHYGFRRLG